MPETNNNIVDQNIHEFKPRYYLGLCAIAEDETTFIREWIAYHHYIGFEKIYIYDNESSHPIRDIVSDFYDQGIVDTYRLSGYSMQNTAYDLCLKDHGEEFFWLAFFDLDEFLCLKEDQDARMLLHAYEDYPCLSVNWEMFSSSGHLTRPQGFVTLNYTDKLSTSHNCKCILQPRRTTMAYSSQHFEYTSGHAVNADFMPTLGAYALCAIKKVCLNHYYLNQSKIFVLRLKKTDATYGIENPRRLATFFDQATQTTTKETSILKTAIEVEINLRKHNLAMRIPIILNDTYEYNQDKIIAFLTKLINNREYNFAEVLFDLTYVRFQDDFNYLTLGFILFISQGKKERALALVEKGLRTYANPEAYLLQLEYKQIIGESTADLFNFLHYVAVTTQIPGLAPKILKRLQEIKSRRNI